LLDSLLQEKTALKYRQNMDQDLDMQYNDENFSSNAVKLQQRLTKLKQDIIRAKAACKAEHSTVASANNPSTDDDGDLYGSDSSKVSDELYRLTRERTQTFLNFTHLQVALKAAQANKAITRAFNLETDGKIKLEQEEEDHVRSLLEEQKELTVEVFQQHEAGVELEMDIIKARLELAQLHSKYAEMIGGVVESRRNAGSDCWGDDTVKAHKVVKEGDRRINQMRFMIQKFMLSFNKFGLQFDDPQLNERYKALLLRCGKTPEQMRKILAEETSEDEEMRMAPAAAADLQN